MVDTIKGVAASVGAVCYADPFLPSTDNMIEEGVLARVIGRLSWTIGRHANGLASRHPRAGREQPIQAYRTAEQM